MKFNWDKLIDMIQFGLFCFIVGLTVLCILVLILFDVLAGTGVMLYLTNGNVLASVVISLATSGLMASLMLLGYTLKDKKSTVNVSKLVLSLGCLVYILDVYFDSLGADYLRYGEIVVLSSIPNWQLHASFRSLIAGISSVGEVLSIGIVMGLPVLKGIINNAIPEGLRKQYTPSNSDNHNNNREVREPSEQPISKRNLAESRRRDEPTYHPIPSNRYDEAKSVGEKEMLKFEKSLGIQRMRST